MFIAQQRLWQDVLCHCYPEGRELLQGLRCTLLSRVTLSSLDGLMLCRPARADVPESGGGSVHSPPASKSMECPVQGLAPNWEP